MQNEKLSTAFAFLFLLLFSISFTNCEDQGTQTAEYPTRPISFLVPWAAGGMTDMSSRMVSAVLQKKIGQPVNVINRTGGGGVVGHLAISSSRPDGYTLGAVTVEITMLRHLGLTDLSYKNYTPLALLINNAAGVTVRSDATWNNLDELLAEVRANPGKLQASGTARGGIWDLARMGMLKAAGLEESAMPWVPSQGAAPALQELLAGGIDVVTASLTEVDALRKAGQVKTLGVMSEERLEAFPEVPTLKEQGLDWSIGGWVSVCAPAGISPTEKAKLDSSLRLAIQDPEFITALKNAGSNIQYIAGAELEKFMADQDELNGQLLKDAGIGR